jgi:hypothetical protein
MFICAAFARNVAYSLAETRTPIVALRTAAGSALGRPPADLRVLTSGGMVGAWSVWVLGCGERSEDAPQGKPFERSENMACS